MEKIVFLLAWDLEWINKSKRNIKKKTYMYKL